MPMKSEAMRRAMFAAKAGKSTLGIPQSVGKKFAAHDRGGDLPERIKPKAGQRDYPKYAVGGTVAPGQGPIEVTGHWGPMIQESGAMGEIDDYGMFHPTGMEKGK